jgi:hypothetical protein
MDVSVNSCGHVNMSIAGVTNISYGGNAPGTSAHLTGYRHVAVQFYFYGDKSYGSINIRTGGQDSQVIDDVDLDFLGKWAPIASVPKEEAEFFIGSYLGVSNFFRGFIGDFEFNDWNTFRHYDSLSTNTWDDPCTLGWYHDGSK